jgi:hypothetical protein
MEPIKWEIWHGFNTVFFLSVLTVLAGLSLSYWIIKKDSLLDAWRRLNQRLFFFPLYRCFFRWGGSFHKFFKTQGNDHPAWLSSVLYSDNHNINGRSDVGADFLFVADRNLSQDSASAILYSRD